MKNYIYILAITLILVSCTKREDSAFSYFENYNSVFSDKNPLHIESAQRLGITPLSKSGDAELHLDSLVEIKPCENYDIAKLSHSVPYLVPQAAELLNDIGRIYNDSLDAKGLQRRNLIVTSVLRTGESVTELQKKNANSITNSPHLYGVTFDIAYNNFTYDYNLPFKACRYVGRRIGVEFDRDLAKYKSTLAEVLDNLHKEGRCYIMYEKHQHCFHITVR